MGKSNTLTFIYLLFCLSAFAQHYEFKTISTKQGLIGSSVYSTIQDRNGFMWFLTDKALCRYNGENFEYYGKNEGYTEGGGYLLFLDSRGTIWTISFNFKLFYFDGKRFIPFKKVPAPSWICEDKEGNIYVGTRNSQFYKIDSARNTTLIKTFSANEDKVVRNIIAVSKNYVIGTNSAGMLYIKGDSAVALSFPSKTHHLYTTRIYKLKDRNALVSSGDGIYTFNTSIQQMKMRYPLVSTEVLCYYEDEKKGDVWVGTNKGCIRFKGGIIDKAHAQYFLKDKVVLSITQNKEGVYWFGTLGYGIIYNDFLSRHLNKSDGLIEDNIRLVKIRENFIYSISENLKLHRTEIKKNGIKSNDISPTGDIFLMALVKLAKGDIYLKTSFRYGLYQLGPKKTNKIALRDSRGLIAYENSKNLYTYSEIDKKITFYGTNKVICHAKLINQFRKVDPREVILPNYISGDTCLHYVSDLGYEKIYLAPKTRYYRNTCGGNYISGLTFTKSGNAVLWTKNNGIILIKKEGNKYISKDDGLVSNYCNKLFYHKNQLWVGTENGLSRIKLNDLDNIESIENYSSVNYLIADEVKDIFAGDSLVYVATSKGISIFNPDLLNNKFGPPGIYIRALSVNNHAIPILEENHIAPNHHNLTITFGAISTRKVGTISYKYRLKSIDAEYNYTNKDFVYFSQLLPGEYEFEVYASLSGNTWSKYPAKIKILVPKQYWQENWFKASATLLAMLLIASIFHIRYRTLKKRNEMKRQLAMSEIRALRLQMNPHFLFNTLNSLQKFVLQHKPIEANKYIAKFSRLMRWIMEYSEKQQISLKEEMDFLSVYIELEQFRFNSAFEFIIDLDPNINTKTTYIPSLVVQPFVENAIKHGLAEINMDKKGLLFLSFNKVGMYLEVIVSDNGVGREKVKEQQLKHDIDHISTGIKSITERLTLLNKNEKHPVVITDLYDLHGNAAGTHVKLLIPINYE